MTVAGWLSSRVPTPPDALGARILARVGSRAQADETEVSDVCAQAAARTIAELIGGDGCARDHAIDLLAADALTTYAIEASAGGAANFPDRMDDMVRGLSKLASSS